MTKTDMHVHSKFSGRPSDWFLQRFGTNESYTEPETIFNTAIKEGMDFIVITDHNRIEGSLILKEKYPDKTVTGCEFTVYFPEDQCKIHILVYDITIEQFNEMDILRKDIYQFRNYIKSQDIAYSVAHATYSVNGKLTIDHLEKLVLLFDVFEGINGSRNKLGNETWMNALKSLTPSFINTLVKKHKIEPISKDPWIKGFTGGSDDHAGLYIGKTHTLSEAVTVNEFILMLKNKKTSAAGRHNDYRSFAFTLYKILFDYSKNKTKLSNTVINKISDMIFGNAKFDISGWLMKYKFKKIKQKDKENFLAHFSDLIEGLQTKQPLGIDEKFSLLFNVISDISDAIVKNFVKTVKKKIKKQDYLSIFQSVSALLPGIFISLPFFSTLTHMYSIKPLLNEINNAFPSMIPERKKRIMWFTDTLSDLNGVSVTLKKIGWFCHQTNRDVNIVSCLLPEEINEELPPNFINMPFLYDFKMPFYETIQLKLPSLLKSIEMLYGYEPDEVFISSPGPVGFFGFLFAKLINAKTKGIYHTDFTEQADKIVGHKAFAAMIESVTKWFYMSLDETAVPTAEYIDILEKRGFERKKMTVFKRGIDDDFINISDKKISNKKFKEGFTLIYAGRISEDKNLDFLINVFKKISSEYKFIKLKIAGNGPYFEKFSDKTKKIKNLKLYGRVKRKDLVKLYLKSDLFVFPSNTDTFGMVVMEAQASGLPALVTDIGGPQEIIIKNKTGFVLSSNDPDEWAECIAGLIDLKYKSFDEFQKMKMLSRQNIIKNYDWEIIMENLFGENKPLKKNHFSAETAGAESKNKA